jgi:hypothetical protein
MKRKLLILCLFLVVLLAWFLRYKPETAQQLTLPNKATNQTAEQPLPNNFSPTALTNIDGVLVSIEYAKAREERMKQRQALVDKSLDDWRTPIEFYGRVVDENTNPVAGAQVGFGCNDISKTGTSNYETTSDDKGGFSIKGIKGKLLSVNITKEGYYSSKQDNGYYTYAGDNINFVPDQSNPIVFHLRKKGVGEPLVLTDFPVGIGQIAQLHHDGTPVELNLLNGTQAPAGSGQLKLELWRDISDIKKQPFDWKLQLSMFGGGLIPTDDEFAFQAPESGYQPSLVIDMPATNQPWMGEVRSKYYIQLPDGKYGRIDFYLLPYNGVFTLHSAINPDGSRNLEPK